MVPQYRKHSSWWEHAPFAFWLADASRPRIFVELGTYFGFSYFTFCQAFRDFHISCAAYAIDNFSGDHFSGTYGEDVYQSVHKYNSETYLTSSNILRCTFTSALDYFNDGSIDLLHIDGSHSYDDVRNDYESWFPKLSTRSIVLFHDTNVRDRSFGVWRFWSEIAQKYPSFEFLHGSGLGVLCVGDDIPLPIRSFMDAISGEATAAQTRLMYSHLGRSIMLEITKAQLERDCEALQTETDNLHAAVEQTARQLAIANEYVASYISMVNSSTWRVTYPVRQVVSWLPPWAKRGLRALVSAGTRIWTASPRDMRTSLPSGNVRSPVE